MNDDLLQENARLREEINVLRSRIEHKNFWSRDFARLFGEELDELTQAHLTLTRDFSVDAAEAFELWHQDLMQALPLLQQKHDEALSARVRSILINQWVYVRWLEIVKLLEVK